MDEKPNLEGLKQAFERNKIHVVGRTMYRTARIKDILWECTREEFEFIENLLPSKDNHVVVIFQVLWHHNGWKPGLYYAFLHDMYCLVGTEILVEDF